MRLRIKLPEKFSFHTKLTIRISDINYGQHLGNDTVLTLLHEARVRFLSAYGFSEHDLGGSGLVVADAAIIYKSQGFYGDRLQISIAVNDFHKFGFDLIYLMKNLRTEKEIARAKTGIIIFDYQQQKIMPLATDVREKLSNELSECSQCDAE